jgi:hypothetical protein
MLDGLVLAVPHRETGNIAVVCSTLCYDSVFRILADSEPGERARHLVEPIVGCSRALLDCGVTPAVALSFGLGILSPVP